MVPLQDPSNDATAVTARDDGSRRIRIHAVGLDVPPLALSPQCQRTIGRARTCDFTVVEASLSRSHAAVHRSGDRIEVEDLGSRNGTWVRGERIAPNQRVTIAVGEAFRAGEVAFLVHDERVMEALAQPRRATSGPVLASPAMQAVYATARQVARGAISVLLLGETGVGKEVLARAIHDASPRASAPFVVVNCPALPEQLIESELFGHEKGAFSGAAGAKVGLLEQAHGGTVFFDEVGELPLTMQTKLLRVLEDRQVVRVGGTSPRALDLRFVAATNRDLEQQSRDGTFRSDLYYRLNGISLTLPSLRDRPDDIEPLAEHFLKRYGEALALGHAAFLKPDAIHALRHHDWPGNVRELRNVIERAALLAPEGAIGAEHLHLPTPTAPMATAQSPTIAPPAPGGALRGAMEEIERQRIVDALTAHAGNQTRAAEALGISRRGLSKKLDKYGIPRPKKGR
jgi:DNA-binding NtrC family response regulator